jgi:drug/metabolite transporter (DMT)-like permease
LVGAWIEVLGAVLLGGDGDGHGGVAGVAAGLLALHVLGDEDLLVGGDLEVGLPVLAISA